MEDMFAARRRSLMAQQAELQRQLDQLETVPNLEDYPDGTIIRARIRHGASAPLLTWVFLKVVARVMALDGITPNGMTRWYTTGVFPRELTAHRWVTSDKLARWLTEPNRVIVEWTLMVSDFEEDEPIRVTAENAAGEKIVDELVRRQFNVT